MRILFTLVLLLAGLTVLRGQTCPNRCLDFDGTGDHVSAATAPVTGNADFTAEARFVCMSSGTSFRRLFAFGGTNTRIEVGESNGSLRFLRQSSTGSGTTGIPFGTIRNNGWHHLAVKRSGGTLTFYVDCDSVFSATFSGTLNINAFRVGSPAITVTGTVYWDGQIDEVRVWSTARTSAQIDATCGCGLDGNEGGLLLYYDFDQTGITPGGNNAGQTTVQDETSNNNDGTLNTFTLDGATSNWVCGDANFPPNCSGCAAAFTFLVDDCNNTVQFTNQTPPNTPGAFSWNFGDGGTSTQTSPSHTYAAPGVYNVCLTLIGATGAPVCTTCQTVTVNGDNVPPVADCHLPFSLVLTSGGFVALSAAMIDDGSTDNCGIANMYLNTDGYGCSDICGPNGPTPNHVVVLTVEDYSGNSSTCTTVVSVVDNTPPVAICKNVQVSIGNTSPVLLQPADVDGGSSDNCGIVSMNLSPNTFSCPQPCPQTVVSTLTVTDCSGNSSTCTSRVLVMDVLAPAVVCPPNVTLTGTAIPGAPCQASFSPPAINATDNCGLTTGNLTMTGATTGAVTNPVLLNQGVTVFTYTATDLCGNSTICTYTATVVCDGGPVCQCGGFTNLQIDPLPLGGKTLIAHCDTNIYLPCPNATGILVSGNFACSSPNCPPSNLVWELRDNGGTLLSSGALSGSAFTLTISGLLIANPGSYQVILRGDCGQTTCQCRFWLVVEDCPPGNTNDRCGKAVVTCFPGFVNNNPSMGINTAMPAFGIVDVRDRSGVSPGTYWAAASGANIHHPAHWNYTNTGLVFGIAIDDQQNFYVSSTTLFGCPSSTFNPFGPGGAAGIYQVTPSDVVSTFITTGAYNPAGTGTTIPNSGSGLGNLCYDAVHDQLFVTNFSDGMIYRIKNGLVVDRFDPFSTLNPNSTDDPDFVALDERPWGIGYNKKDNRVYFSRWREDRGRRFTDRKNEIWCIALNPAGGFATSMTSAGTFSGGDVKIIDLPNHLDYATSSYSNQYSNPVSDIAFSEKGRMLVAERSMRSDCGDATKTLSGWWTWYSHQSRVLEYEFDGTIWDLTPGHAIPPFTSYPADLKFKVGPAGNMANSSGGVDYGYDSFDPVVGAAPACDKMAWMTGDALLNSSTYVYGLQGNDAISGGGPATAYHIDYDGVFGTQDKVEQGDVEIFKCKTCEDIPSCDPNCVVESVNMSTGYDQNSNTIIATGSYDNDWTLIESPDPGISVPTPAFVCGNILSGIWADQPGATYISAYPYPAHNDGNLPPKKAYVFENCFCVCEDSAVVTIDLSVHVDNMVDIDLYTSGGTFLANLLDVTTTTSASFTNPPATATYTTTLAKGTYCIRAGLRNVHPNSAMGLNIQCIVSGGGLSRKECCNSFNSIVGEKYRDTNCNGDRGNVSTEPGLPGWEIQLCDLLGNVLASTFTDAYGYYHFNNVAPGTYMLKEVNQPTWSQSEPSSSAYTITIGANEVAGPFPFGNCKLPILPCDSISGAALKDSSGCCYTLVIENSKPNYFTGIGIQALPGGTLESNPQESAGWSQQSFGPSPRFEPTGGGYVPNGIFDVTHFCLENLTADVQQVEVLYYVGAEIVCRDTLTLRCDACVEIHVEELECIGLNQFELTFCIETGALPWTTGSIHFTPPPGLTIAPVGFSLPDLPPNTTSCSYTVNFYGALTGTACITATIHEQDIFAGEPDINCCSDTFCIELPECDPCDSTLTNAGAVAAENADGECCWNITLNNPPNYFVTVQTAIQTPGWEFSAINNYSGSGWVISTNGPMTSILWDPNAVWGNYVPASTVLPTVCIDYTGSGSPTQPVEVLITWTAADQTVCTDVVYLTCPDSTIYDEGCVVLQTESLNCTPNGTYQYTFTVYNNTDLFPPPFTAGEVTLVQIPSGSAISPTSFTTSIAPGDNATFTTNIFGSPGDQVCFYAVLHEAGDDSLHLWCCPTVDTICLTLPPCNGNCELACIYNTQVAITPPACSQTIYPQTILEQPCPGLVMTVFEHFGATLAVHAPSYTIPANSAPLLLVYAVNPVTGDSCWGYVTVNVDPGCQPAPPAAVDFTLFPNPANTQVNLVFDTPLPAASEVRILDMTGKVRIQPENLSAGTQQTQLDVSSLTPGMYVADVLVTGVVALRKRFVVQRSETPFKD